MKYLKIAGIVWGFAYFLFGAWSSFTLNSIDFWSSVTLLFCLFLLPFPIAVMGVWLPRAAGVALVGCILINVGSVASVVIAHHALSFAGSSGYGLFVAVRDIPHLLFGGGYILLGRAGTSSDSGSEEQSTG